ncbi:glycoside hydrolase domain-containing protein [Dubosiella newyorkensis]|nr:glycoside hydrolase domain-containing protein [Dubosiella newyorkensis]
MSDQYVLQAQKYLNATYKGKNGWIPLEENGNTGTLMIEGLIRAFQIQNKVPNVTGYLGPYTVNVMKNLPEITKMDPEDESDPNVCLIQCALFCKGYHAGGITGIYYNAGVAAVKEMQEDANIGVNGIINWKVWMGLFSMYWFKLVAGGNPTIRLIQRQINQDYSNNIGVQACDGVMSRNTSLSLVAALQVTLGMHTWIDDLNTYPFGPTTANLFAQKFGTLMKDKNSEQYTKPNKLAQYGLYFNGIDQTKFDGIFDSQMASNVAKFQDEYGLTGMIAGEKSGEISYGTMWSLLTSRGDPNRLALACDTSWQLNDIQAKNLYDAGYRYIGRYLTGTVGVGSNERPKNLDRAEIDLLTENGLSIFPIYQDGGSYLDYFRQTLQGSYDAVTAINTAQRLGFKNGTVIYFAVDFDCLEYQTKNYIVPYFQQIKNAFRQSQINPKGYKIGIYAPRLVCTQITEAGHAEYSFVSDMSTGFSGNLGYPIPKNWAFDQFDEFLFSSQPSFDLDKCGYSGRDSGCTVFEKVESSEAEKINQVQSKYTRKALKSFGVLDKLLGLNLDFNDITYNLGTYPSENVIVTASVTLNNHITLHPDSDNILTISFDEKGEVSESFKSKIQEICEGMSSNALVNFAEDKLVGLAESLQIGNIGFTYRALGAEIMEASITVETDRLYELFGVTGTVSCELLLRLSINDEDINFDQTATSVVVAIASCASLAVLLAITGVASPGLLVGALNVFQNYFPAFAR